MSYTELSLGRRQRILIVDDCSLNIRTLKAVLCNDYEVSVACNGKEALAVIRKEMPDLILLDILMPEMDGYEVCRELQKDEKTRDIPIIFLTVLEDEGNEAYGLELGALDYIRKPFSTPIVRAKVRNHLELKKYKDLLKRDVRIDGLTRIANRRRFEETFNREMRRSIRSNSPLSVLMIDIDMFKAYNDTYGHLEGDDTLRLVAKTLERNVRRPGDLVARWGGEEFTALLPDTNRDGAFVVAEQMREAVEELGIIHEHSSVSKVITVSIGVATSSPLDPSSYSNLLRWADETMFRAKELGRNRVVCHEP